MVSKAWLAQRIHRWCSWRRPWLTVRIARASIEDEYSRKLMALCRKPLGSQEVGGLKVSLDVVRGEVEGIAKQHQGISAQMKSELEEPLAAFAGAMKERRKIVQNGVEKLLKIKIQQTQTVNKVDARRRGRDMAGTRDAFADPTARHRLEIAMNRSA